jgi:two-component system, NtrC family, response regulator AtoC
VARILIAEDEPGVRSFLCEALELVGHEVTTAKDGIEAVMRLKERAYDVLLTDLRMPGADGLTVVRTAAAEQPELQVIVLTAHGTVEVAVECMKLGAFDFLQKPVSGLAELRLLVGRAVERKRLLAAAERESRVAPLSDIKLTWGAPAMAPVVQALRKVAPTTATVLLLGDSGTGKEVTARAVHGWSPRAQGAFVAVNCAALSEQLLESELFGHEKGAFTGATARRQGRIELADGGTFFLDEIGELKLDLQAKLLRVLEERRFERVGGNQTIEVDVRWVAATNRDVLAMVDAGEFREDLYHRLAVFPVQLPPLCDRPEDIAPLTRVLLAEIAGDVGKPQLQISKAAMRVLETAQLRGNVRGLRNALERAAILADDVIGPEHFALPSAGPARTRTTSPMTLDEIEKRAILDALASVGGHRKKAAEALGIGLRTLYDKLKRYDITS